MTTILEIIDRISFLAALPSVVGLFIALAFLMVGQRWQIHALGMALLYFFAALLYTRVTRPEIAVVKLLIGWMIALTLYLTGGNLNARRLELQKSMDRADEAPASGHLAVAAGAPFRGLVLVAIAIVALASARRFPLPQVPNDVGMACYLLGIGGIFLTGLSEDPFQAGLGLLAFLTGFDLLFSTLVTSLVVIGLVGAASFLITLAVTFLAVTHAAQWDKGREP